MEDLKGRAVRGGFVRLIGQGANLVLRLGFIVAMARLLSPEDFGLVAMVTVVTGVYDIFTTAGLSSATIQKTTISHAEISNLFWINILVGSALGLLCVVTAPSIVSFYNEPRLFWVTVALGLGFLLTAAGVQHSAMLQRQLRYVALTTIEMLSLVVSFAVAIVMAFAGYGYWALVGATLVTAACTTASVWIVGGWIPSWPRRNVEVRSMLRFGGTIILNNLVVYLAYNSEKLLLGRFWGADVLGLYGRAYQLIIVPMTGLHSAVGGVAFSALSRLQDDPIRLKNYFLKGYSLVASMTVPISVFSATFADDIILVVLGPKWTAAAPIFRLLTPTILVFGIINPTAWLLQSAGMQVRSLHLALVIAPLVITAYLIGMPYGPNAVAGAYSAAMILWLVPHIVWSLHNTGISPADIFRATWRPLVASAASAAVAFFIQHFYQSQSSFLRLSISGIITGGVYAWLFLFVMGQKAFYFDLLKGLRASSPST